MVSEMTVGFDLWLGFSGRGRASNVSFFFVLGFICGMVIIYQENGRMDGLQVTSDVIHSWERIAMGTSFHWIDGEAIEGKHSICTTQHPQMMHQDTNE